MSRSPCLGFLVCGLFLAAIACDTKPAHAEGDVAKGRALSQTECSHCHGRDGNARSTSIQVVPMLAGQPAAYLVQEMVNYADGIRADSSKNGNMAKRLRELSVQDIEDIAAFYEAQKRY